MTTTTTLLTLILSGLFGGLIHCISRPRAYEMHIPFSKRRISIGFVGDVLIGIAASVGIYSVVSALAGTSNADSAVVRIASIGIIAGYAGRPLLDKLTNHLTRKLENLEKAVESNANEDEARDFLRMADAHYEHADYEHAIFFYDQALHYCPENDEALLNKARAYRKKGMVDVAIQLCTDCIRRNPTNARAHYNLACYLSVESRPSASVCQSLATAIELFPFYRTNAAKDPDFDSLRSTAEFAALLQRTGEPT